MGGLGIKNLEALNIALLSKWRWRMLVDAISIWYNLLQSRWLESQVGKWSENQVLA
ncbi:hypothetical protein A2U01_0029445 [Trifolium medium]|uniref:Uncharacterized protein n=1 Tax=Trifolium medium TaxID=97028 RepID=A0A392P8H7_9FABA|nr:hypothetical protein [Trifolium medium]